MSEPHRLSGTVVWLLGRAAQRGHQLAQERLAAAGIRKWHYAVLAALAEFGQQSQADIGRRLGLDRNDVHGILNRLESHGQAARQPDPADRRRNVVRLTDTGRRYLSDLQEHADAVQDELLAGLDGAERRQLQSLLAKLLDGHPPQPA